MHTRHPRQPKSRPPARDPIPWRIHVVMRRPLRHAVVLLRGPKKLFATFSWDLDTDRIAIGQMMRRARIDPQECDLSADGRWFQLHIANSRFDDPVTGGDYTVIARPPYVHAVYLKPRRVIRELVAVYPPIPPELEHAFCSNIFSTLPREGWVMAAAVSTATHHYSKAVNARWTLVRCMHTREDDAANVPIHYNTHVLVRDDGLWVDLPEWSWAEVDAGDLVWGRGGRLWRAREIHPDGPTDRKELADFRELRFRQLRAPYDERLAPPSR